MDRNSLLKTFGLTHRCVASDVQVIGARSTPSTYSMSDDRIIDLVGYPVGLVGGLFLLIGAFVRTNRTFASRHLRIALAIAGVSFCGWGTLGLIERAFYRQFPARSHALLHHYKDLLSGAGLGILLLEIVSGEFVASHRRYKQAQGEQQGSADIRSDKS